MYRLSAKSRATTSSTAIFLSQQSRQNFSSPRGSDTSLAPHSTHRDLTTRWRDMASNLQFTSDNVQGMSKECPRSSPFPLSLVNLNLPLMHLPADAGLRHLALNVRD